MIIYVILKKDCAGIKICGIFLNEQSAQNKAMQYNDSCNYDAKFYVEPHEIE